MDTSALLLMKEEMFVHLMPTAQVLTKPALSENNVALNVFMIATAVVLTLHVPATSKPVSNVSKTLTALVSRSVVLPPSVTRHNTPVSLLTL